MNPDISPRLHQIPVIHDGDFQLTEALPIIRYVTAKFQLETPWYPSDAKAQATVDEYFSWTAHNMYTLGENKDDPEMTLFRKFQDQSLIRAGHSEKLVT